MIYLCLACGGRGRRGGKYNYNGTDHSVLLFLNVGTPTQNSQLQHKYFGHLLDKSECK